MEREDKGLPAEPQGDCHYRDLTQEQWEQLLFMCIQDGDVQQFCRLWERYPTLAKSMMREFEETVSQNDISISGEDARASWARFIDRMKEQGIECFSGE